MDSTFIGNFASDKGGKYDYHLYELATNIVFCLHCFFAIACHYDFVYVKYSFVVVLVY